MMVDVCYLTYWGLHSVLREAKHRQFKNKVYYCCLLAAVATLMIGRMWDPVEYFTPYALGVLGTMFGLWLILIVVGFRLQRLEQYVATVSLEIKTRDLHRRTSESILAFCDTNLGEPHVPRSSPAA
jgi:hypothetical protein